MVPAWVQILSALLTPAIAITVGVIGWLQWRTNERKRKQDLFDRRYEFYKRALAIYEEGHSERAGNYHAADWEYFYSEAEFLFGDKIVAPLEKAMAERSFDLSAFARPFKPYIQLN